MSSSLGMTVVRRNSSPLSMSGNSSPQNGCSIHFSRLNEAREVEKDAHLEKNILAGNGEEVDVPPRIPEIPHPVFSVAEIILVQLTPLEILKEAVVRLCDHSPASRLFPSVEHRVWQPRAPRRVGDRLCPTLRLLQGQPSVSGVWDLVLS